MALYTNNMVAKMQAANDFDGIIKMADDLLAKNPQSALAQNVRLQAYANKKDYAKVIELGQAAADAQTDPADKSLMYYLLGAAYNAKEMKPQAIAAFKQVTDGPAAENARLPWPNFPSKRGKCRYEAVRENPLFLCGICPTPSRNRLFIAGGRKPRCPAFVPGRVLHFRPGRGFALRWMWKSCRMPGLLSQRKRGASVLRMRGRVIRGRGCRRCCFGCVPVRCGSAVSCPYGLRIPLRPSPATPRRPSSAGRTRGRRPGWCASGPSGCGGNNSAAVAAEDPAVEAIPSVGSFSIV